MPDSDSLSTKYSHFAYECMEVARCGLGMQQLQWLAVSEFSLTYAWLGTDRFTKGGMS